MASREQIARLRRMGGDHAAMAQATLESNDPFHHQVFNDWLLDNSFKGEPMLEIGQKYSIETNTFYYVGLLIAQDCDWLVLDKAAKIPDHGRFSEFLQTGVAAEVEPLPEGYKVYVPRGAITAVHDWFHDLLREVV